MSEPRRRRRGETTEETIYDAAPVRPAQPRQTYAPADDYQRPYTPPRPEYRQPQYDAPPVREVPVVREAPAPAPVAAASVVINNQVSAGFGSESYFDGGLLQWIGWSLLGGLLTTITFGLGAPFAMCMLYSWEAKHTVINGRRLRFDGNGWQLLGKWILWLILTAITFGIFGFWLFIKVKKWRTLHTHFA